MAEDAAAAWADARGERIIREPPSRWAAAADGANADVISLSLGGAYDSSTVRLAVDHAWGQGAVLTCAAGNDGTTARFYPAAYTNCIAVGATDQRDARAWFSNYDRRWVDVAAPGVGILSTVRGGGYEAWNGTSMATPHVAGVAGLILAAGRCGTNQSQCIRSRIEQRADRTGGSFWAHGRINAYRSVSP